MKLAGPQIKLSHLDKPQQSQTKRAQVGVRSFTLNQSRFLAAFAVCGQMGKACRWAGIHRQSHFDWLDKDPTYEPRFRAAEAHVGRMLTDEAIRRAHDGVVKNVYYQGRVVGQELNYSDGLMIQLLRAFDPQRFLPPSKVEYSGPGGSAIPTRLDIEFIRPGAAPTAISAGSGGATEVQPAAGMMQIAPATGDFAPVQGGLHGAPGTVSALDVEFTQGEPSEKE